MVKPRNVDVLKGGETEDAPPEEFFLPDEVKEGRTYIEGAMERVPVNAYGRNPRAAGRACVTTARTASSAASASSGSTTRLTRATYVHHLKPLAQAAGQCELDPAEDLRPVCPNCHAMLHKRDPPYSVEELKDILGRRRGSVATRARR